GIRAFHVTGVQTCALPIYARDEIPELRRRAIHQGALAQAEHPRVRVERLERLLTAGFVHALEVGAGETLDGVEVGHGLLLVVREFAACRRPKDSRLQPLESRCPVIGSTNTSRLPNGSVSRISLVPDSAPSPRRRCAGSARA